MKRSAIGDMLPATQIWFQIPHSPLKTGENKMTHEEQVLENLIEIKKPYDSRRIYWSIKLCN